MGLMLNYIQSEKATHAEQKNAKVFIRSETCDKSKILTSGIQNQ